MAEDILFEKIDADPNQPRQKFVASELAELKNSIKEKGILVPLILEKDYSKETNHYLLIDGERRYRCAKELKLKSVPATITAGPLSFENRMILRFHIQEQHKNWTIFDKARAIYDLKKHSGLSIIEIAEKLSTSAPRISNWLSITYLTGTTQKEIVLKKIPFSYLIHLIKTTKDYLSFSKLSQRQIEEKIIKKIEADIFKTTLEFQKFSRLMSTYTHYPEKLEFLEDVKMSLSELFKKAELEKQIDTEELYKILSSVKHKLNLLRNKDYTLSKESIEMLENVRDDINEFL